MHVKHRLALSATLSLSLLSLPLSLLSLPLSQLSLPHLSSNVAALANSFTQSQNDELPEHPQSNFRDRLRARFKQAQAGDMKGSEQNITLAGLAVSVWRPSGGGAGGGPTPLVLFSHGFMGTKTQSQALMHDLAAAGYMVIAPDHQDAHGAKATHHRPVISFREPQKWSDTTYLDRHDDFVKILQALHSDPQWERQIDWSKIAVCGHSLGGYTALGVAGAWPTWKIKEIKAAIALSPAANPYLFNGAIDRLNVPVLYEVGSKDFGITTSLKSRIGAYSRTSSPAHFVDFNGYNHFAWTNFCRDADKQQTISFYCIAFLDKYLKGVDDGRLNRKLKDVLTLESK